MKTSLQALVILEDRSLQMSLCFGAGGVPMHQSSVDTLYLFFGFPGCESTLTPETYLLLDPV
jgi:hypothetical protein